MHLTLTKREAETLEGLLRDYAPALSREIARTENHALRHMLVERLDLAEALLERLSAPAEKGTPAGNA